MNRFSGDLAVIIVTWNTRDLALDALRTLCVDLHLSALDSRVIVVDNASSDGTPDAIREQFPTVTVLAQQNNLGFGGGNNVGLRALGFCDQPTPNPSGPRAVFLLNSDTLTQPGAIRTLYHALFSLPRAGVVGARLTYADGSFQHSAFGFPGLAQIAIDLFPVPGRLYDTRLNGRYSREYYAGHVPFPVDHTLGATIMLRREAIEQTGLFDEQFFMYVEEIDWSMRIRRAGWQIYAVPAAHIVHLEGRSTRQIRQQSVVNLWSSRLRFYCKYYSRPKLLAARWLVRLGMQRKLRALPRDGSLSAEECAALAGAYRTVIDLYARGWI